MVDPFLRVLREPHGMGEFIAHGGGDELVFGVLGDEGRRFTQAPGPIPSCEFFAVDTDRARSGGFESDEA